MVKSEKSGKHDFTVNFAIGKIYIWYIRFLWNRGLIRYC